MITISGSVSAQDEIIDLKFAQPAVMDSDASRTLESLVKVQGTGGLCQDGLYLLTHYGDRQDCFENANREAMDNPMIDQTWRYCSIFSAVNENSVIMGRNWDNQNVGSIIISLYHPPGANASISFTRAIDLGFPLTVDLEKIKSSELGNNLLLAPFYAMDGINEHGLSVAVAGVRQTAVKPLADKELVFVTFLIRKILDHAKTVEEVESFVEKYIPFDLDKNSLNSHFFVVDSSGRSVVLEYAEDRWRKTYGERSQQILTNKSVFDVPDAVLREQCWRYRSIAESLEEPSGNLDWKAGMKILQDTTQQGTTWSVIYSLSSRELYFAVYQKWDVIYHLDTL